MAGSMVEKYQYRGIEKVGEELTDGIIQTQ